MVSPTFTYRATVLSVYDGDTMTVAADAGFRVTVRVQLRLLGINAPEMGTDAGRAARDYLRSLCVPPLTIRTYKDPGDKYGRWLADVYSGDLHVNQHMVDTGHAVAYDGGAR